MTATTMKSRSWPSGKKENAMLPAEKGGHARQAPARSALTAPRLLLSLPLLIKAMTLHARCARGSSVLHMKSSAAAAVTGAAALPLSHAPAACAVAAAALPPPPRQPASRRIFRRSFSNCYRCARSTQVQSKVLFASINFSKPETPSAASRSAAHHHGAPAITINRKNTDVQERSYNTQVALPQSHNPGCV
jgi:hypothetical protein